MAARCRMTVAAEKVDSYHDGGVKVCEAALEPPKPSAAHRSGDVDNFDVQ